MKDPNTDTKYTHDLNDLSSILSVSTLAAAELNSTFAQSLFELDVEIVDETPQAEEKDLLQ